MSALLKNLRALADPARVRLLRLLIREELSVAEMQEILGMRQSRISTHLALLRQTGLVEDRRSGKNTLYRVSRPAPDPPLLQLAEDAAAQLPEAARDLSALHLSLEKRKDKTRAYFNELAGKFGKHYVPGRSWKGLAEALLALLPPLDIADLGAGEGTFSQLLARRARSVIAVDNSEKMVAYAQEMTQRNGVANVEFRLGDLEDPPIAPASIDLAFFSQSLHHAPRPGRAVAAAFRLLRPGGRIAILDLKRHGLEEARELYADLWLGFGEVELQSFLLDAGFEVEEIASVHREEEAPNFETLLAVGRRAA
jgi:ArsR family transcriptional regulator